MIDVFYTNSRYAKVGGLPGNELNQLELQFILLNDFRLVIPPEEMQRYGDRLLGYWEGREAEASISVEQSSSRDAENRGRTITRPDTDHLRSRNSQTGSVPESRSQADAMSIDAAVRSKHETPAAGISPTIARSWVTETASQTPSTCATPPPVQPSQASRGKEWVRTWPTVPWTASMTEA